MAQRKGKTGNPYGRPKGTPNKVTSEIRLWIKKLIDENREQLEKDLLALDPKDRWNLIEKLMSYTTPKLSNIDGSLTVSYENMTDEQLNEIINGLKQKLIENGQNET